MSWPADRIPDGDVSAPHHFWVGLAVTAFSFGSVWPHYPVVGAAGTLLGLAVAVDDALEHAFGIPTPLDLFWSRILHPLVVARLERLRD